MNKIDPTDARCVQYEFEISIKASRDAVWKALIEETNAWWLPEFRMVDAASVVEFDVRPGGRGLIETGSDGSFLQWYTVQFYLPDDFEIYMVGNLAPKWGGPSTTNLYLALLEDAEACILRVADAHHGRFDDGFVESLQSGWQQLFGDGLRRFVEQ